MTELAGVTATVGRRDEVVIVGLAAGQQPELGDDLRRCLPPLLGGGVHTVLVDLSAVDRLSSNAVAALLWVKRTCDARRISVVLSQPSGRLSAAIHRGGLGSVFEIERRVS